MLPLILSRVGFLVGVLEEESSIEASTFYYRNGVAVGLIKVNGWDAVLIIFHEENHAPDPDWEPNVQKKFQVSYLIFPASKLTVEDWRKETDKNMIPKKALPNRDWQCAHYTKPRLAK